ncbi:exodeoxyribonuclease VII large subunit [Pseudomonas aeruginosa]|uniref:exodeoxyribonuclease VII large subunit n=1 Tax=Pseudomonas aeruginosa TaxID=287 RepID=UPI001A9DAB88|nr:exodeoxyribonuclease VII large subunit [Pseudomonas aeruginosa]HCE6898419.1 hypothetical protein [Pseudomonas aeruginosa]HCE6902133.1 hypothetical protein [Pseudomonas aeruginosa]HCE7349361.1 hypothetical protein [Pseudomonas aeruginosa]HCE7352431.1 hypothetical protein [Pseudomonas aeruginosa]HCE9683217.1 hypothetical protein [Pseudomonas aeruginosa]
MRGIAAEVKPWTKAGDSKVTRIYGRLVLGDASIRFELQPYASIQDDAPVVLHGTLRIKNIDAFRATHEVILVGDVVGTWVPQVPAPTTQAVPLIRQQPRVSLEVAIAKYGLEAVAILATGTAWNDLTTAANPLPVFERCRRVETNFVKPEQFLKDLAEVCWDPAIQVLVIARGGGGGLEIIGDSPEVAAALLASRRPFYTALGHDDNVMLDKHADRAFSTPSILGQALAETARSLTERQGLEERLSQSIQENESLREQLRNANERLVQRRAKSRNPRPRTRDLTGQPARPPFLRRTRPPPYAGMSSGRSWVWSSSSLAVARRNGRGQSIIGKQGNAVEFIHSVLSALVILAAFGLLLRRVYEIVTEASRIGGYPITRSRFQCKSP